MTDLHAALELAVEDFETTDLTRDVLVAARRRRNRRRGAVAAVAAGVAVAGVVVVPRALDSTPDRTLPGDLPPDVPTPTPSQGDVAGVMPLIEEDAIQQVWDPRTAADLPYYPIGNLPQALDPFASSEALAGDSTQPMVLTVTDNVIAVFYDDGGWVPVDRPDDVGEIQESSLSRDGQRAVLVTNDALWWFRTTPGGSDWTKVEVPRSVLQGRRTAWTWDSSRLYLAGLNKAHLVDLDSGEVTEQPHLSDYADFDVVAGDGHVVARQLESGSLAEWDGLEQATPSATTGELGGLNHLTVFDGGIAATRIDLAYGNPRYPSDGDGIVALSRQDLSTTAFLPFTGVSGQWVDGEQVRPVQWLNKVTVLLSVFVDDTQVANKVDRTYLVAWDTLTGDKGLVGSYNASVDLSLRDLYPS